MLPAERRNPQIIGWNRLSSVSQFNVDGRIVLRGFLGNLQHSAVRDESLQPAPVARPMTGLGDPKAIFPYDNNRESYLSEMLASRATRLHGNKNLGIARLGGSCSLLVLGPQPRGNCFLDVSERFVLVFALRHAPRQGRAFGDDPAVLGLGKRDMENHNRMLPTKRPAIKRVGTQDNLCPLGSLSLHIGYRMRFSRAAEGVRASARV
jgi:hypothetical protein